MPRSKGRISPPSGALPLDAAQEGDVFPSWHELSITERLFLRARFQTTTDTAALLQVGKMKDLNGLLLPTDSPDARRKKLQYARIRAHAWIGSRRKASPAFAEALEGARKGDLSIRRQIERSYLLDRSSELLDSTLELARSAASEQTRLRALELALKLSGFVQGGTGVAAAPKEKPRALEAAPLQLFSPANEREAEG